MSKLRGHRKVEDVKPRLVELINHEAHDALAMLGDHADAVALTQTADEVFLEPRKLEAATLDVEHLGHIAANHPADVNPHLLLWLGAHRGLLPCRPGMHRLSARAANMWRSE